MADSHTYTKRSGLAIFFLSALPLLAIFFSEATRLFFFIELKDLHTSSLLINILISLQLVFFFPIGLLSDRFCRKRVLVTTVIATLVSIILFHSKFVIYALIIHGILGAVSPVALAAYCDVHISNERKPNIINAFIVRGAPYIVLSFFATRYIFWASTIFGAFLTFFLIVFFIDDRDSDHKKISFQFPAIKKEYGWGLVYKLVASFILVNTTWNLFQYYYEETASNDFLYSSLWIDQGVAFFLGTVTARFVRISIKKMIGLIFILIASISTLMFFQWIVFKGTVQVAPSAFSVFTFLGGIGLPLIYALFGEKIQIHQQGMLYGLWETLQTLTEFLGPLMLLLLMGHFPMPISAMILVLLGSYVSVLMLGKLVVGSKYANRK